MLPGVLRGLADVAAGRVRPAADVFRDLEAKYGLVFGKKESLPCEEAFKNRT